MVSSDLRTLVLRQSKTKEWSTIRLASCTNERVPKVCPERFARRELRCLGKMAGTTRLELATSAVTDFRITSGLPPTRSEHRPKVARVRSASKHRLGLWTKARNQRLPTNWSFGTFGERTARTSRMGGWPKKRLYSRLNCVVLS